MPPYPPSPARQAVRRTDHSGPRGVRASAADLQAVGWPGVVKINCGKSIFGPSCLPLSFARHIRSSAELGQAPGDHYGPEDVLRCWVTGSRHALAAFVRTKLRGQDGPRSEDNSSRAFGSQRWRSLLASERRRRCPDQRRACKRDWLPALSTGQPCGGDKFVANLDSCLLSSVFSQFPVDFPITSSPPLGA